MDLSTVTRVRAARTRADLALAPDELLLAGGTWIYSDPRPEIAGHVDLTTMGWPSFELDGTHWTVAATATMAELASLPDEHGWAAHPLLRQCCDALLGSFKVWNAATVGGNIANSLPAGPMTSLAAALDAEAVIWRSTGDDDVIPVSAVVTGDGENVLGHGDVLRAIRFPLSSLRARTAFRKIALSPLGRSGAVVIGRLDEDGGFVLTVTAATVRPEQLRYDALPSTQVIEQDVAGITSWFTDPHGAADWRAGVSAVLASEIVEELGA